jgi:hypothetical protein
MGHTEDQESVLATELLHVVLRVGAAGSMSHSDIPCVATFHFVPFFGVLLLISFY